MKDFFVSYTGKDETWATWVAAVLEKHGYSVIIQAWDFRPGEDFVARMNDAIIQCTKCICILSEEYITSTFCQAEWTSVFANDPTGESRSLIPVRISDVNPTGLLKSRIFIDLFEIDEDDAIKKLIDGVQDAVPRKKPAFPGEPKKKTIFPSKPPICLKYARNWDKNIIYMTIADKVSLDNWMQKTREEKRTFLYGHFAPMQFLILGAKLFNGSLCYKESDENWRILGSIEMVHNSNFENAKIHIFEDYFVCSIDNDAKEFNGHIGM